jgi:transmembrane sensor
MDTENRARPSARACEEAGEWLIEFRSDDADAAAKRRFAHWLRASPENVAAYLEMAALWDEGSLLDRQRRIDVDALLAADPVAENVVPLHVRDCRGGGPVGTGTRHRVEPLRKRRLVWAAAAVLVCGVALTAWNRMGSYSTALGEQRSLVLADGSTVSLNSRSRIRVRFTNEERLIELAEGQALFRVAKEVKRPFIVASGATQVRAVGTQFDVYRKSSGTVVTVLEGRVTVASRKGGGASDPTTLLGAGEQLELGPRAAAGPVRANVLAATAWTQRRIVFESASLHEVAEEFNRYNTRRVVVVGDGADLHISGAFSSTAPEMLASFLRNRPELRITETGSEITIARR